MSTAEQGIPNDQGFKNGDPNANVREKTLQKFSNSILGQHS